ncbi:CocE/NonD family hydrolase C-terminal non-catalytic domain-containing protein, partial [Mycobacteroides abscessus]
SLEESRDDLQSLGYDTPVPLIRSRLVHHSAGRNLLTSRRAVDEAKSVRGVDGDYLSPWHPTGKGQKMPVEPGVSTTLDIDLTEVDAMIKTGHRLRVVISAASLPRYIPSIPELWASRHGQSVVLDPDQPSYLVAPVVIGARAGAA